MLTTFILSAFACVTESENKSLEPLWAAAPLTELSGNCPSINESDVNYTIESAGESRIFRAIYPENAEVPYNLMFFYHSLIDTDPVEYWSNAIGLQSVSNDLNTVIIMPQSLPFDALAFLGMDVFLWNVETGTYDNDLQLYDDLRTCAAQNFDLNMDATSLVGVSGGALFSTILLSERSDNFASVVEFSGGSDLSVATFQNLWAEYNSPTYKTPTLLVSGGEGDVYPDPSMALINFHEASNTLQSQLAEDGHVTVRCQNNIGHISVTGEGLLAAWDWVNNHRYNEPSPYAEAINGWDHWCEHIRD